jgi:hypothetical protein
MVISVWLVGQLEALAEGEAAALTLAEALALGMAVVTGWAGELAVVLVF